MHSDGKSHYTAEWKSQTAQCAASGTKQAHMESLTELLQTCELFMYHSSFQFSFRCSPGRIKGKRVSLHLGSKDLLIKSSEVMTEKHLIYRVKGADNQLCFPF